jgi:hypothetical protein
MLIEVKQRIGITGMPVFIDVTNNISIAYAVEVKNGYEVYCMGDFAEFVTEKKMIKFAVMAYFLREGYKLTEAQGPTDLKFLD